MASRLNRYIQLHRQTRQAMEFYQGVFGGKSRETSRVRPADSQEPAARSCKMLETENGFTLMVAETPQGMRTTRAPTSRSGLTADEAAELHGLGEVTVGGAPWPSLGEADVGGDEFGMCRGQFGINGWFNIVSPDRTAGPLSCHPARAEGVKICPWNAAPSPQTVDDCLRIVPRVAGFLHRRRAGTDPERSGRPRGLGVTNEGGAVLLIGHRHVDALGGRGRGSCGWRSARPAQTRVGTRR